MAVKKTTKSAKTATKLAAKKKVEKVTKPVKAVKTKAVAETAAELDSKEHIIAQFAQKPGDTGSPEVQVALLTFKITRLTSHLETNKKDNHSRRGLLKVIAKRRRILNYLQKLDEARYKGVLGKLELKK